MNGAAMKNTTIAPRRRAIKGALQTPKLQLTVSIQLSRLVDKFLMDAANALHYKV